MAVVRTLAEAVAARDAREHLGVMRCVDAWVCLYRKPTSAQYIGTPTSSKPHQTTNNVYINTLSMQPFQTYSPAPLPGRRGRAPPPRRAGPSPGPPPAAAPVVAVSRVECVGGKGILLGWFLMPARACGLLPGWIPHPDPYL